jgi:hypothetical protein
MSIFNFFDSSWKKKFEEFISEPFNARALKSFIRNSYEIYDDMRTDDKILLHECESLVSSDFLPLVPENTQIKDWPKEAKKYVLDNEQYIISVYKAYEKYSTLQKRVIQLRIRYSKDNIFRNVFKTLYDQNTDWENLSYSECMSILTRSDDLILAAHINLEMKKSKERALKMKMAERAKAKRISILIKKQQSQESIISLPTEHSDLTSVLDTKVNSCFGLPSGQETFNRICKSTFGNPSKNIEDLTDSQLIFLLANEVMIKEHIKGLETIYLLADSYKEHSIFSRVMAFLVGEYETIDNLNHKQVWTIISQISEFEAEKKILDEVYSNPIRSEYMIDYLTTNDYEFDHNGVLCCLSNLSDFDHYIYIHDRIKKFKEWMGNQAEYNLKSKLCAQNTLGGFNTRELKMYVNTIKEDGGDAKKIMTFNHYSKYEFTQITPNIKDRISRYKWIYSNCNLMNEIRLSVKTCDSIIITDIANFIAKLDGELCHDLTIIFVPSDQNIFMLKNRQLSELTKRLNISRIQYIKYNPHKNETIKSNIIVIEVISDVEPFRNVCRAIAKQYPYHTLGYISLFSELTKKQVDDIKIKFH